MTSAEDAKEKEKDKGSEDNAKIDDLGVDPVQLASMIWSTGSTSSRPSHVLTGFADGLQSLSYCTLGGLGLAIALPAEVSTHYYHRSGVLSALGAGLASAGLGLVGAACLVTGGASLFLWDLAVGLYRTPAAVLHRWEGKRWDAVAQEWNHYNLAVEREKVFDVDEEAFLRRCDRRKRHPRRARYSPFSLNHAMSEDGEREGERETTTAVARKTVADRALYDLLGVEPDASAAEIKKAYHAQARRHHPDRNAADPHAKLLFQRIGQAYTVLGDARLRREYDLRGQAVAAQSAPSLDAATLYTLLFGSDAFDALVGELRVATLSRAVLEQQQPHSHRAGRSKEEERAEKKEEASRAALSLAFRQRHREFSLSEQLAARLDLFRSDRDGFRRRAVEERESVLGAHNAMGALLLRVVGEIYRESANMRLSRAQRLWALCAKPLRAVSRALSLCSTGYSTTAEALAVRRLYYEAEKMQDEEDKKNGMTREPRELSMSLSVLCGPAPSAERQERVKDTVNKLVFHIVEILWGLVKEDVQSTLRKVCFNVLHDASVSNEIRESRVLALHELGKILCEHAVDEKASVQAMTQMLGQRTGLFAHEDEEPSPAPPNDPLSRANVEELLRRIKGEGASPLSVREIKDLLALLGQDSSHFLEKSEMLAHLQICLENRLK